ncbi:MAG: TetR/AcrR family transcriptional regulator [Opitutus sp.]|nr:TetR/AcrR family transcriptional regulator [Opitutus sp.]
MAKTDKVSKIDPLRARRDEEKEERRQAILDAAEKVISRDGWEATNFGEIAKRARLSRSLVYFYFPTRDDLFHAVCGRGLTDMEKRFASALASARTGLDQVMAIGRTYYQFSLDEPLYFKVLADYQGRDLDPDNESENEAAAHGRGRNCLAMVAQALGQGLADGTIRKSIGDPRPTAVSVWAFTHGLIQIASRKEAMLKKDFGLTAAKAMDHGFALLRGSLSVR